MGQVAVQMCNRAFRKFCHAVLLDKIYFISVQLLSCNRPSRPSLTREYLEGRDLLLQIKSISRGADYSAYLLENGCMPDTDLQVRLWIMQIIWPYRSTCSSLPFTFNNYFALGYLLKLCLMVPVR